MLNSSGNLTICQPQKTPTFIPLIFGFIFFVGFVLNCISLWIFWFKVKIWKPTVVLQFNLAIADAIFTPVAPLIVAYYLNNDWIFGLFFCRLTAFLLSTHTYGSIYFLTLISIHRYFTVAQNVKKKAFITKPYITKVCLIIWGFLVFQGMPSFLVLETSEVNGATRCLSFHQTEHVFTFFVWIWLVFFFCLLIPFIITLVCYSLLIRYILRANPMNTLSKVMFSKSVLTIFVSLLIFIICYIPVHINRSVSVSIILFYPSVCSLVKSVELGYSITWMLSATNCCLDPIVYCFASERFQKIFTSCWTFHQRQHLRDIKNYAQGSQVKAPQDNHCTGSFLTKSATESDSTSWEKVSTSL
ncbi:lysophosphatidic acid receptor 6-like [Hyperolius riggenbachi]|uniref:lysophosphatidic acid receptor 6-like n=1 Tax=Hyperolius riggenbachi TaxID=752182 RepID=UPI0035A28599